jgi:CHAT domain-containing protein
VVFFATHGLVPGELTGLNQPALALSAPEVAGIDGDGLLTQEEVLGLSLGADWVVLSACNTASADGRGGEALSGLGRAFFYAGARSLLLSHWPVETVSARLLTTRIFVRDTGALSKAQAVQAAMKELIETGEARAPDGSVAYAYAHPLFWAPFTVVGDAR